MIILGLSIELSAAAIMIDGEVIAAAQEERFSRIKNDERFPLKSIEFCLNKAGIEGNQIDMVAIPGKVIPFGPLITRVHSTFTIKDHIRANYEYWYPTLYNGEKIKWTEVFKDKLDLEQYPGTYAELIESDNVYYSEGIWNHFKTLLHNGICSYLGIPSSKIVHFDHHACHAAYAYWGSPVRDISTLVLTADAFGDDLSASIGIAENNTISRIFEVPHSKFRLARLYRYITLLLGMKPNEHEYKVMGLAPYAKPDILKRSYEIFKDTMIVDGLDFSWKTNPPDMYFFFKEKLEGERFDGIAGGLQKYTEEILCKWVKNAIEKTGLKRIVFSGGIAMNVKAHKAIHELDEVDDLFVCGNGSDESLAIGVCYQAMAEHCSQSNISTSCIKPVDLYLGPQPSDEDVNKWVNQNNLQEKYQITEKARSKTVAKYLSKGAVIARCSGPMEFGARALGNRSIMADPRHADMVEKINHKIKNRDFWMPFAPSILKDDMNQYLDNPKNIQAPFMTIAFNATSKAKKELRATLHPSDFTLRPQLVDIETNPDYYSIIKEFKALTGVGGILNTSFNLHGEPIVCSPDDALHVFENSEIDMMLINDVLVSKQNIEL